MDLREYYRKIRRNETEISDVSVVIASRATPDGGRAGVLNEVPRSVAARLIVEEKADLATADQAAGFRAETEARWKTASGLKKA
jgi:hypothetical protein